MPNPLVTAAKAARLQRDTDHAETAAREADEVNERREAEYVDRVKRATFEADLVLGTHADGIRWYHLPSDATPYGTHDDLPDARLRFEYVEPGDEDNGWLALCAIPADLPAGTGRPVRITESLGSLAALGDALAAWDEDQSQVGR